MVSCLDRCFSIVGGACMAYIRWHVRLAVFVMESWAESLVAQGKLIMLSDGNLELVRALDMVLDARSKGMGYRSKRFALIVSDGVVEYAAVDDAKVDKTGAAHVFSRL
jgi:glutaredoxin/glutathione-dependent peroxiredoxin